jgi:hypothetical protein
MDDYTATEIAYKNGYNQALKDFTEKVKTKKFKDIRWYAGEVAFGMNAPDIDQLAKELEKK